MHHRRSLFSLTVAALALLAAPARAQGQPTVEVPWNDALPPGTPAHVERALAESSRHGEFVDIPLADGQKLNSWVVYPER